MNFEAALRINGRPIVDKALDHAPIQSLAHVIFFLLHQKGERPVDLL
jgi:hypothetical protein